MIRLTFTVPDRLVPPEGQDDLTALIAAIAAGDTATEGYDSRVVALTDTLLGADVLASDDVRVQMEYDDDDDFGDGEDSDDDFGDEDDDYNDDEDEDFYDDGASDFNDDDDLDDDRDDD